jgi:hypothetical protein
MDVGLDFGQKLSRPYSKVRSSDSGIKELYFSSTTLCFCDLGEINCQA